MANKISFLEKISDIAWEFVPYAIIGGLLYVSTPEVSKKYGIFGATDYAQISSKETIFNRGGNIGYSVIDKDNDGGVDEAREATPIPVLTYWPGVAIVSLPKKVTSEDQSWFNDAMNKIESYEKNRNLKQFNYQYSK